MSGNDNFIVSARDCQDKLSHLKSHPENLAVTTVKTVFKQTINLKTAVELLANRIDI
jgi:hypothetical protein